MIWQRPRVYHHASLKTLASVHYRKIYACMDTVFCVSTFSVPDTRNLLAEIFLSLWCMESEAGTNFSLIYPTNLLQVPNEVVEILPFMPRYWR